MAASDGERSEGRRFDERRPRQRAAPGRPARATPRRQPDEGQPRAACRLRRPHPAGRSAARSAAASVGRGGQPPRRHGWSTPRRVPRNRAAARGLEAEATERPPLEQPGERGARGHEDSRGDGAGTPPPWPRRPPHRPGWKRVSPGSSPRGAPARAPPSGRVQPAQGPPAGQPAPRQDRSPRRPAAPGGADRVLRGSRPRRRPADRAPARRGSTPGPAPRRRR